MQHVIISAMAAEFTFRIYPDVGSFLKRTQSLLEEHEAADGLTLGICLRLQGGAANQQDAPLLIVGERDTEIALIAIMTPPFNLIIAYLPELQTAAVEALASFLRQTDWKIPGVVGPAAAAETFALAYGSSYSLQVKVRSHRLNSVSQTARTSGTLLCATEEHHALVLGWAVEFHAEATPQDPSSGLADTVRDGIKNKEFYIFLNDTGAPVSMVKKARPTRQTIAVNFVYTPAQYRGHGYASAAVATLSQQLLDEGFSHCMLFTDLANPTANSIYKKIGYKPVVDFSLYSFAE